MKKTSLGLQPGDQIAELGIVDVLELRNSVFPRYTINQITFDSPVTGLTPDSIYHVVGDYTHLEGNTFSRPPETIFLPYLSRSEGSAGIPLQVNEDTDRPINWTDDFGSGDRFFQMSITAAKLISDQRAIDFSNDRLIFSEPQNVLSISSNRFENFPHLSDDGLRIYFSSDSADSNVAAPFGELPEIYMAERPSLSEPFGDRIRLGGTQAHVNFLGSVSSDELSIYYASFEPPVGQQVVDRATRNGVGQPFDFENATPMLELNDGDVDVQLGHITADGLSIYYNAHDGEVSQAYVANRQNTSEPFLNPMPIGESEYLVEQETRDGLALLSWSRATGNAEDADLFMATREHRDENYGPWRSLGSVINTPADETFPFLHEPTATIHFSSDHAGTSVPQDGPPCCAPVRDFWQAQVSFAGDYDFDHAFSESDIDALSAAIRSGEYHYNLDNNQDGQIDVNDYRLWVTGPDFANTYVGDANLDGEFNSSDLIVVFQAGEYEDNIMLNSTWAEGDWNGDGEFDTGDLVHAFQDGGYEIGPRIELNAVPEPTAGMMLMIGAIAICRLQKRCTNFAHRMEIASSGSPQVQSNGY